MKGFLSSIISPLRSKKNPSTLRKGEATDAPTDKSQQSPDPDKIKDLPPAALKIFKASGLSSKQALEHWGVFLNCLYYSTPKNTFEKPPPIIDDKREINEESLVYPNEQRNRLETTMSDDVVFSRERDDLDSASSQLSDSCLPCLLDSDQYDLSESLESLSEMIDPKAVVKPSSLSLAASQPVDVHATSSEELDTDFDPKALNNNLRRPKSPKEKRKKKKKKKYTEAELDALVIKENPKDIYKDFREIGRGAYGKVYIATDKNTKKKLAVKHLKKEWDEDPDSIANEITLLKSCQHTNVVNYMKSYLFQNRVWMVMEYVDAGTLKQLLVIELNESQIASILQQALRGLEYLHTNHRIHRDIKSANILMNMNGEVKLADLGLCIENNEKNSEATGMAGSKYWMAPEMIKRQPYNSKVDIWSLGALCTEMCEGAPPYGNMKPLKALFLTATEGAAPLKRQDKWSSTMRDFIGQCFITDPSKRPSATELLKHPLMSKVCERKELVKALKFVFLMRVTAGL